MDVLLVLLALFLVPGMIWATLDSQYGGVARVQPLGLLLRALQLGAVTIAALYGLYLSSGTPFFDLRLVDGTGIVDLRSVLDEISFAILLSVFLSVLWLRLRTHRIPLKLLHILGATRRYDDESVWMFLFNSHQSPVEYVHVRDVRNGVVMCGWIDSFSERDGIRELVLRDAIVYDQMGGIVSEPPHLYIARPPEDIWIEFPHAERELKRFSKQKQGAVMPIRPGTVIKGGHNDQSAIAERPEPPFEEEEAAESGKGGPTARGGPEPRGRPPSQPKPSKPSTGAAPAVAVRGERGDPGRAPQPAAASASGRGTSARPERSEARKAERERGAATATSPRAPAIGPMPSPSERADLETPPQRSPLDEGSSALARAAETSRDRQERLQAAPRPALKQPPITPEVKPAARTQTPVAQPAPQVAERSVPNPAQNRSVHRSAEPVPPAIGPMESLDEHPVMMPEPASAPRTDHDGGAAHPAPALGEQEDQAAPQSQRMGETDAAAPGGVRRADPASAQPRARHAFHVPPSAPPDPAAYDGASPDEDALDRDLIASSASAGQGMEHPSNPKDSPSVPPPDAHAAMPSHERVMAPQHRIAVGAETMSAEFADPETVGVDRVQPPQTTPADGGMMRSEPAPAPTAAPALAPPMPESMRESDSFTSVSAPETRPAPPPADPPQPSPVHQGASKGLPKKKKAKASSALERAMERASHRGTSQKTRRY